MKRPAVIAIALSLLFVCTGPVRAGLQDGLLLYYSFDVNGGGTVADDSGQGHTGTVYGATYTPGGAIGGAYHFDGIDDHILGGSLGYVPTGSICFWMYADVMESCRNPFSTDYASWDDCIRFEEDSAHSFYWGGLGLSTGPGNRWYTYELQTGRWYHVAMTWDGFVTRGYLDGTLACSMTYPDANAANPIVGGTEGHWRALTLTFNNITVGNGYSTESSRFWKGLVDEVRIYNRPLSSGEVARLSGIEFNHARKDFDGDGLADLGVVRRSKYDNTWYVYQSLVGALTPFKFGLPSDIPIPADYDGDGVCDVAVLRPSTMTWFIFGSSEGPMTPFTYGLPGDIPVPDDYDGDGVADIAVVRPSTMTWYIFGSSEGPRPPFTYGLPDDIPAPADYDADGYADVAVFRPSTMTWYIFGSRIGPRPPFVYGLPGDIPVPGDYDGDGMADVAVFRPSNATWYIFGTESGQMAPIGYGVPGDVPLK